MKKLSALEKYRIILPFLEHEAQATSIAKELNFSVKTIRSWITKFRCKGLVGLEHQTRKDRGEIKVDSELLETAKALALQKPPLTIKASTGSYFWLLKLILRSLHLIVQFIRLLNLLIRLY